MANIESFRTRKDIPDDKNLEHEFVNSSLTISHESIKRYADLIAADFTVKDLISQEREDNNNQKVKIYVIDSLSDEKITDAFFKDNYHIDDSEQIKKTRNKLRQDGLIQAGIARIRRALIAELRGKITGDVYIVTKDYRRLYPGSKDAQGVVGVAYQLKTGNEVVYKDPAFFDGETKRGFLEADKVFQGLDMPPGIARHFRKFIEYDEINNLAILEKRDFVTLNKYLNNQDRRYFDNFGKKEILASLQTVRDCLEGAKYLSDNGLMLQDIGPHNIGIENTSESQNKNGLLFDLEGLTLVKQNINSRIGIIDHFELDLMLDRTDEYMGNTSPFEMVYQFGTSLQAINEKLKEVSLIPKFERKNKTKMMKQFSKSENPYEKLYQNLDEIINRMTAQQTRHIPVDERRINLADSLDRLTRIIEEFEKSNV